MSGNADYQRGGPTTWATSLPRRGRTGSTSTMCSRTSRPGRIAVASRRSIRARRLAERDGQLGRLHRAGLEGARVPGRGERARLHPGRSPLQRRLARGGLVAAARPLRDRALDRVLVAEPGQPEPDPDDRRPVVPAVGQLAGPRLGRPERRGRLLRAHLRERLDPRADRATRGARSCSTGTAAAGRSASSPRTAPTPGTRPRQPTSASPPAARPRSRPASGSANTAPAPWSSTRTGTPSPSRSREPPARSPPPTRYSPPDPRIELAVRERGTGPEDGPVLLAWARAERRGRVRERPSAARRRRSERSWNRADWDSRVPTPSSRSCGLARPPALPRSSNRWRSPRSRSPGSRRRRLPSRASWSNPSHRRSKHSLSSSTAATGR